MYVATCRSYEGASFLEKSLILNSASCDLCTELGKAICLLHFHTVGAVQIHFVQGVVAEYTQGANWNAIFHILIDRIGANRLVKANRIGFGSVLNLFMQKINLLSSQQY